MSLNTTTISASINGGETNTFGAVAVSASVSHTTGSNSVALTNGSGSGAAQIIQEILFTTGTGGTTIDLTALGTGFNGAARSHTAPKGLLFENMDGTNSITIAPGASNGWQGINGAVSSNALTLEPGGFWMRYNPNSGIQAVDSTHKTILITASAGTPVLKMTIVSVGS